MLTQAIIIMTQIDWQWQIDNNGIFLGDFIQCWSEVQSRCFTAIKMLIKVVLTPPAISTSDKLMAQTNMVLIGCKQSLTAGNCIGLRAFTGLNIWLFTQCTSAIGLMKYKKAVFFFLSFFTSATWNNRCCQTVLCSAFETVPAAKNYESLKGISKVTNFCGFVKV